MEYRNFLQMVEKTFKIYHLIACSQYGLMVQIRGGLITYLLMVIYCHEQFNEPVFIKRIRQLRITIQNDAAKGDTINQVRDTLF
jgi:hypothetical protein